MTAQAEIHSLIERIGETFSRLDIAAWADCFHTPLSFVMAGRVVCFGSREETIVALNPMFEELRQRGFDRTELNTCNIKQLSETTGLVAAVWTRYAGTQMLEQLGATYFVMQQDSQWKAVFVTSHSADVLAIP